jgi:predicted MFS family arabinose efflux permease
LFEFGQFGNKSLRIGLIVLAVSALGQAASPFVMPVFLQAGHQLSPATAGWWQLPHGVCYMIGANVGGRLARHMPVARVVQIGLGAASAGYLYMGVAMSADMSFVHLLPLYALQAGGSGLIIAQATNLIMSDVDPARSGAAGGALNTARQMGTALGVAIIGSLLNSRTIAYGLHKIGASSLPDDLKARAASSLRADGIAFQPPADARPADLATIRRTFVESLASGARWPFFFAAVMAALALSAAVFLPRSRPVRPQPVAADDVVAAAH